MGNIEDVIKKVTPLNKKGKPLSEHLLIYDSSSETLEPLYFWILDLMNASFKGKVTKITDNFSSSPGSGHFSELRGKASQMQQEASRVLGTINNILKGVLNLIYDLKEFKIRLSHYDAANSSDKSKSEAGTLALKQIWMDRVDIQRGQGSINALSSGNLNFITLRDSFLAGKGVNDVDKMDLNERVKRILKPRVQEFEEWRKNSEKELRKRYEIEKLYLKSQVAALKLNAQWARPYLRAAQRLESTAELESDPALVSIFNTILLELTLMGQSEINIEEASLEGNLPPDFRKRSFNKRLRKYHSVVFVSFKFRGIPSKAGQHYLFGGRAEVSFKTYVFNDDELTLLKDEFENSGLEESLKLIQGMTDESLLQLKIDIDELLDEKKEDKKDSVNINPFAGLFSFLKVEKKDEKEDKKKKVKMLKEKGIKRESYAERYVRNLAEANTKNMSLNIYDIYKKAHGMAGMPFPYPEDEEVKTPQTTADRIFGFR